MEVNDGGGFLGKTSDVVMVTRPAYLVQHQIPMITKSGFLVHQVLS